MKNLPDPSEIEEAIEIILRYSNIIKALFDILDEIISPSNNKFIIAGEIDTRPEEVAKLRQENQQLIEKLANFWREFPDRRPPWI